MKSRFLMCIPLACALLAGCKDEQLDHNQPITPEETLPELSTPNTLVSFSLGGEVEPLGDEARAMTFELKDRNERREGDGSTTGDYANEFSPTLKLKEGDTHGVLLTFVREKDNPSDEPIVFRAYQTFTVVKDGKGGLILEYKGDIPFPRDVRGYEFEDEYGKGKYGQDSKWYVLGLLNYSHATINNSTKEGYTYHGVTQESPADRRVGAGTASFAVREGGEGSFSAIPFISQWHQVNIGRRQDKSGKYIYSGDALKLHFRPQGIILQYDLGMDNHEETSIRRYGVISNALDFSGKYNFSSQSIYTQFEGRDADGIGNPVWEPEAPNMGSIKMHFLPAGADGLSSGKRAYPWHMPILDQAGYTPTLPNSGSPAALVNTSDASLGAVDILATMRTSNAAMEYGATMPADTWRFMLTSGGNTINRHIITMWGMPRKQAPAQPYTYFWISSYAGTTADTYTNSFNPETFIHYGNYVAKIRQEARDYEGRGATPDEMEQMLNQVLTFQAPSTTLIKDEDNTRTLTRREHYQRYSADSIRYYGTLVDEYLQQTNERTQPLLVLHQTNYGDFQHKKIYHAQTVVQSDLLLTEVMHKKSNGENLSVVELYNPRRMRVFLKDYALVRLVPTADGSHLAYRKMDGTTTEDLTEAQLLPLSTAVGAWTSGNFSAWDSKSNPQEWGRYREVSTSRGTMTISYGEDKGIQYQLGGTEYLVQHQTLLIGARGYIHDTTQKIEGLTDFVTHSFRAYADGAKGSDGKYGEGVMDIRPGDAIALVKSDGEGNWQIIDATGPVGVQGSAFAGTYADYKAQFAGMTEGTTFSMSRDLGVNYPFIAPFRTRKMTSRWSDDWTLTTGETHNLGYRADNDWAKPKRFTFSHSYFFLKRTPLDPNYQTTYRNRIPSITRDAQN